MLFFAMPPSRLDRRGRANSNYVRARNDRAVLGDGAIAIADEVEPLDARNSTKNFDSAGFLTKNAVCHQVFQLQFFECLQNDIFAVKMSQRW